MESDDLRAELERVKSELACEAAEATQQYALRYAAEKRLAEVEGALGNYVANHNATRGEGPKDKCRCWLCVRARAAFAGSGAEAEQGQVGSSVAYARTAAAPLSSNTGDAGSIPAPPATPPPGGLDEPSGGAGSIPPKPDSLDLRGLYRKYEVRRTDGRDAPGEKHHGCRLFVLDLDHDQGAGPALQAYAEHHRFSRPRLARDVLAGDWSRVAGGQDEHEQGAGDDPADAGTRPGLTPGRPHPSFRSADGEPNYGTLIAHLDWCRRESQPPGENVLPWLRTLAASHAAQAERIGELEARAASAEARARRLEDILSRSFMLLPIVGDGAMAFVDSDIEPHVRAVADEFSIRTGQLKATEKLLAAAEAERDDAVRAEDRATWTIRAARDCLENLRVREAINLLNDTTAARRAREREDAK